MRESILIVGGGFGQVPAILSAKDLGLKVVVVDKNPDAVGMKIADYSYAVDIIDKEGVLEIAKKHKVKGAMTMQSDLPVPTIGFINDRLGLKGVNFETAQVCSNKNLTRQKLKDKNAAQPIFEIVKNLVEAEATAKKIGFPCVVKAPDSSGSRGITKISKIEEVTDAYNESLKYARQNAIIIEEFIEGIEFGAQTFSVDGKCELVLLHNDTMSHPPYMIPIGHSFPFVMLNEEESKQAIADIKNAVEAVGIENGPANIDLILDVNTKRV
ncbi:MAG: ATP-grasp domain-containing protein [Taibaiella sp.]|nr:ATP-grasp domain-containing protein [Taibaiella sp.]